MKKATHPLLQLLVMLAISLGMMLVSSIVSAPILLISSSSQSASALLWVQALTQLLTFFVPVLLTTLIYYRGQQREYYKLDFHGRQWYYALVGIVVMTLLVPLNDSLTQWNEGWNFGQFGDMLRSVQDKTEDILRQMMSVTTVGGLLSNLLVVALVAALCEEVFFRAGIQNLLFRWVRNPHVAIWLTALIFSLGHGEVFAFVPRFVMGATLGYLYHYSNSILPNFMAHFFNNALVVVLYWLSARGVVGIDPEAPLSAGLWLTVGCTLAALALFFVTFGKKLKIKQ